MTLLYRVRTTLTGFPGGPGVSTMYFLDVNTAVPSVRAFWDAVKFHVPNSILTQTESVGDAIESTTGELVTSFSKPSVLPVAGQAAGAYAGGTGAVVSWLTGTVSQGRRLRGRTFIVPLPASDYELDGTLQSSAQTALKAAADALIFEQSLSMAVWGRPRAAVPADGSRPAVTARVGTHGLVTDSRIPDLAAVLRSRRD